MLFVKLLPQLSAKERLDLAERLERGSGLDADFYMAMVLSTGLASLGLLQNSIPVIIGAMLVAPLVWPLLTAGLGLVQGNARLFRKGVGVTVIGLVIGLAVSGLFGIVNPGFEPTMEVEARGTPDLLDLCIAFLSGLAAAYAVSRTEVFNIIAGVAIAAALVPPLSVVGIAFAGGRNVIAVNASILLGTNIVAIILGAAIVFRLMGARVKDIGAGRPAWERVVVMAFFLVSVLLVAPLFLQTLEKQRVGPNRPLTYPVSPAVRKAVREYIKRWPDTEIIMMGRQSVEPETGISIMLASPYAMPEYFDDELKRIVRQARRQAVGREPAVVRVFVLQSLSGASTGPEEGAGEGAEKKRALSGEAGGGGRSE